MKKYFFLLEAPQALVTGWRAKLRLKRLEERPDGEVGEAIEEEGLMLSIWGVVEAPSKISAMRELTQYRRRYPSYCDI